MNSFAWALTQLKEGHKVRRKEWPNNDYMKLNNGGDYHYIEYFRHEKEGGESFWFDHDEDANFAWVDVVGVDWVGADDINPNNEVD